MRHNNYIRTLALVLSVSLLVDACVAPLSAANLWTDRATSRKKSNEQLAWASPLTSFAATTQPRLSSLRPSSPRHDATLDRALTAIPATRGRVTRIDARPDHPLVIHLLDVHGNTEAQKNLSGIVSDLTSRGGARAVALEGAFGPIPLNGYDAFPRHHTLTVAADYALSQHEISGPIHALILTEKIAEATGIDDLPLYRDNVRAYSDAARMLPAATAALKTWRAALDSAAVSFNPSLKAVEASIDRYQSGETSFGDQLSFLMRQNVAAPDSLRRFSEVLRMERGLDTARAEKERADLINALVPRLTGERLSALTQASREFRLGRAPAGDFYKLLLSTCRASGVSPEKFPAFLSYVTYALAADSLDGAEALTAYSGFEASIEDSLSRSDDERHLVAELRTERLAQRLVSFSLTSSDWRALESRLSMPCQLARSDTGDFHSALHQGTGAAAPFLNFYRTAEKRDIAMAMRAVDVAKKSGVAVLVTGGFHADGIAAAMKKAGISLVRVEPVLTAVETSGGIEALSAFTRSRTPIEMLMGGQKLFLAPPPAGNLDALALHGAASDLRDGLQINAAYHSIPGSRPDVTVTGHADGNTVTARVSSPDGVADVDHVFNAKGSITAHVVRFNPVPEILTFVTLALTLGTANAALLLIPAAIVLRALLLFSTFIVHEGGHALARRLTDGVALREPAGEAFESFSPLSLVPFLSLPLPGFLNRLTPNLSTGDETPWKVRLKAAAGPLANLSTALLSISAILVWGPSLGTVLVAILTATALINTILSFTSVTDLVSMVRGSAPFGFFCGVFGIVAQRRGSDHGLLPARLEKKLRLEGEHTQVRGRQAGGGIVVGKTKRGKTTLIGGKYVNPKRSNLTELVLRGIGRLIGRAERKGVSPFETFIGFFHWRFGTSSAPSVLETHWHEWIPPQDKKVWSVTNGAAGSRIDSFNIRIVHNGDFDGIEHNLNLTVFGKKLDVGDIGTALSRILWPNKTKGDSPKIAGMMTLLVTQGMWDASARLAYLLEIEPSLENFMVGEKGPKEISARLKTLSDPLEAVFTRHAGTMFPAGATSFSQADPAAIQGFLNDADEALRHVPEAAHWSDEKRRAFVESALYVFLNNDVEHAVQMFMTMPQRTSTFGLGVMSTLNPEQVTMAAKGQPISIARSKNEQLFSFASEPAAAISAIENADGELLDMDDDGGEIAVIDAKGVRLFSMAERRELSPEEIEKRWVPIDNNRYMSRPDDPVEDEDLVKKDLDDVTPTLARIYDDFRGEDSWNRQTANRFAELLIERARTGHRDNPEEYDLLLIGEEKSFETTERFGQDLLQIFPTLKVMTITGNEYLKSRTKLFRNKIIGADTIVLAASQSGQTFPTLKATRDAEAMRVKGGLKDVFVLTGEWYSKMGKAMGQGFRPDDSFNGRIFCNMSGRRRSESSTVATLSTDFLLTEILVQTARQMRAAFPDGTPFNMTFQTPDLDRLDAESRYYLDVSLPSITGTDRYGRQLKSTVHDGLVAGGRRWSGFQMEHLTTVLLVILTVFVTVSLSATPSAGLHGITNWMSSLFDVGWQVAGVLGERFLGVSVATVFDATIYSLLYWPMVYVLRFSQRTDLWARTGARGITIASPVAKPLRNYIKRLFGEALGHFQPRVDAEKAEDLVNYEAASVARGGLLFAQINDDHPVTEAQDQEIAATKMAVSQAWGIQNFGSGPEIMGTNFDPSVSYKFRTIPMRTRIEHLAKGRDKRSDEVHELLSTRFRIPEMMASGFVFFHAMAERTSRFDVELYQRRTKNPLEWIIAGPAWVLSKTLSVSFKAFFSFVNRVILGGSRLRRLFTPGATQSGTAVATTQLTPDRTSGAAAGTDLINEEVVAHFRGTGSAHSNWSPSAPSSHIPWILAHVYAEGREPETVTPPVVAETAAVASEPLPDISALPKLHANKRISGRSTNVRVNFPANNALRLGHRTSNTTSNSILLTMNTETGHYEAPDGLRLRVLPDGGAIFFVEDPYHLVGSERVPATGTFHIEPPMNPGDSGNTITVTPPTDGTDEVAPFDLIGALVSLTPPARPSSSRFGWKTKLFALVVSGLLIAGSIWYFTGAKIPHWLTPGDTVPVPQQKEEAPKKAGLGLGLAGMIGVVGLLGLTPTGKGGRDDRAERYARALKDLAVEPAGSESVDAAVLINEILAGTAVTFDVAQFGTPAGISRARRHAALKVIADAIEKDEALQSQVHDLMGKPSLAEARKAVDGLLNGSTGAPTLRQSRAEHRANDRDLTLIALRSDLWDGLAANDQASLLSELAGPVSTHAAGTVVVVATEFTAPTLRAAAQKLGRTDITVTVADGLYSETRDGSRLNAGALERAVNGVVRLDSRSSIEIVASAGDTDLSGLGANSALRKAAVKMIDASLRVVEQGTLPDIGLALRAAALLALQA